MKVSYSFDQNVDEKTKDLFFKGVKMLKDIGIPISNNIYFKLDRAEIRHGKCRSFANPDYREISITKYLVNDKDKLEVIIHELLHSCPDCFNCHHGYPWIKYARIVREKYGINITVTCDKEHSPTNIKHSKRRYFTKDEYLLDGGKYLVAIGVENGNKPLWYIKKSSKINMNLHLYSSKGRKLKRF